MNPVIIIPTYICGSSRNQGASVLDTYDHMTPLDRPGELVRCLSSLRTANVTAPIAILVVSEQGIEEEAGDKVVDQAAHFPELDITVITSDEEKVLHDRMVQIGVGDHVDGVSLSGYGPAKNLGLVYAASMGYTEAIFIDDDEVVEDEEFLDKATYGLGMLTQRGVPILIKSGYFLDKRGSYKSRVQSHWYDHFWRQHRDFDRWIEHAMKAPRLSSSNVACGGCLALHREAFRRVSFDPWIPRGEDLDFLLNVRMYGSEVWFDNMWNVRHLPPASSKTESRRFIQDTYRWMYEIRKLEFSVTQIDLLKIAMQSLEPYPGPFLESNMNINVFMTAMLRLIGRSGQRKGYFNAATKARKQAIAYAKDNCSNYFGFQRMWPEIVALLENDIALAGVFENAKVIPMTKAEMEAEERNEVAHRLKRRAAARAQAAAAQSAPAAVVQPQQQVEAAQEPGDVFVFADQQFAVADAAAQPLQAQGTATDAAPFDAALQQPVPASEPALAATAATTTVHNKAKSPFEDVLYEYAERNPEVAAQLSVPEPVSSQPAPQPEAQELDQVQPNRNPDE